MLRCCYSFPQINRTPKKEGLVTQKLCLIRKCQEGFIFCLVKCLLNLARPPFFSMGVQDRTTRTKNVALRQGMPIEIFVILFIKINEFSFLALGASTSLHFLT